MNHGQRGSQRRWNETKPRITRITRMK